MNKRELLQKHQNIKIEYPFKVFPRYRKGHVFDENKSIEWNREELNRRNKEIKQKEKQYNEDRIKAYNEFDNDIIRYFEHYSSINERQIKKIYDYTHQKFNSYGLYDVITATEELIDLFEKCRRLR